LQRRFQHFPRVVARARRDAGSTKHSCEFFHPCIAVERLERGSRHAALRALADAHLTVGL